jgi:hypothetical protein
MRTIELPESFEVTFEVDKCVHARFNGSHTETFKIDTLTNEDIKQYLIQTLTIKRQSQLRSKGAVNSDTGSLNLTLGTWNVPAPGKRVSSNPVAKATEMLNKLTVEQRMTLAKAMGFDFIPVGLPEPDESLEVGEESKKNKKSSSKNLNSGFLHLPTKKRKNFEKPFLLRKLFNQQESGQMNPWIL